MITSERCDDHRHTLPRFLGFDALRVAWGRSLCNAGAFRDVPLAAMGGEGVVIITTPSDEAGSLFRGPHSHGARYVCNGHTFRQNRVSLGVKAAPAAKGVVVTTTPFRAYAAGGGAPMNAQAPARGPPALCLSTCFQCLTAEARNPFAVALSAASQ